jgi:hypothetical protein
MLMALPRETFEAERFMDERTARLEATVNHIQSDITELKGDVRRLDARVEALRIELTGKIDTFGVRFDRLQLAMYAVVTGVFGLIARAFELI